jgi:hypothetical protein
MSHVAAEAERSQLSDKELDAYLKIFTRLYQARFAPWEYNPYGEVAITIDNGVAHIDVSKANNPSQAHQLIWHDLFLSGIALMPRSPGAHDHPLNTIKVDTHQENFAENLTKAVRAKQTAAYFQILAGKHAVTYWKNDPVWTQNYKPHVEIWEQSDVDTDMGKILRDAKIVFERKQGNDGCIIVQVNPDTSLGKNNLQNLVKAVDHLISVRNLKRKEQLPFGAVGLGIEGRGVSAA